MSSMQQVIPLAQQRERKSSSGHFNTIVTYLFGPLTNTILRRRLLFSLNASSRTQRHPPQAKITLPAGAALLQGVEVPEHSPPTSTQPSFQGAQPPSQSNQSLDTGATGGVTAART